MPSFPLKSLSAGVGHVGDDAEAHGGAFIPTARRLIKTPATSPVAVNFNLLVLNIFISLFPIRYQLSFLSRYEFLRWCCKTVDTPHTLPELRNGNRLLMLRE